MPNLVKSREQDYTAGNQVRWSDLGLGLLRYCGRYIYILYTQMLEMRSKFQLMVVPGMNITVDLIRS